MPPEAQAPWPGLSGYGTSGQSDSASLAPAMSAVVVDWPEAFSESTQPCAPKLFQRRWKSNTRPHRWHTVPLTQYSTGLSQMMKNNNGKKKRRHGCWYRPCRHANGLCHCSYFRTDGHEIREMCHKERKMGTMVERIQPVSPANFLCNMVTIFANRGNTLTPSRLQTPFGAQHENTGFCGWVS